MTRLCKRRKIGHSNNAESPKKSEEDSTTTLQMTREQLEDMARVLQNPMLLHKITNLLTFHDLKECRRVNSTWTIISSSEMKKMDCCRVNLIPFDQKFDQITYTYSNYDEERTIQDLNNLLQSSIAFPSTDFSFHCTRELEDVEFQSFFDNFGGEIKTLRLLRAQDDTTIKTARSVFDKILKKVHKVEHLHLCNIKYSWNSREPEESEIVMYFPFLERLHCKRSIKTMRVIVRGVLPNFCELAEGFDVNRDVDLLVQTDKIFTLKKFTMDGEELPENLIKFATAQPRLTSLTSNCLGDNPELMSAFEMMLCSSQNSLEELEVSGMGDECDIKFPKLTNLKRLAFGPNCEEHRCFPRSINLSETFSNVSVLDCTNLMAQMDSTYEKYFPSPEAFRGNLEAVKILKITDCSDLWMKKLHELCPKFKELVLYSDRRLRLMIHRVFRMWPHVTALELRPWEGVPELYDGRPIVDYASSNLDSIFTGLSIKTCERLKARRINPKEKSTSKKKKKDEREKGFKKLRISGSICDLKELKSLRIYFKGLVTSRKFSMSKVSNIYGFSLLPGLEVSIFLQRAQQEDSKIIKEDLSTFAKVVFGMSS